MVGVPRSKGCTTCRKRKIACDQQKPQCQTCQRRGVQCEGYAKFPVVLQWTPDGLKKRRRFEEVAGGPVPSSVSLSSSSLSDAFNGGRQPNEAPVAANVGRGVTLPQQANAAPLILEQLEVSCLESYLPRNGSAIEDLKSSWMWSVVSQPDQGRALGCSFAALCLARIGLVQSNEDLISQAREQYSHGLASLQCALQKPELAFQDRTLAAIRTLSIYELFTLPFTSMAAARKHEEGMTQWCVAAGPCSINTAFALQVFHDVRWCIMNRDIERHKCSILGNEVWKTLPWQVFGKDSLQRLFDIGFDLASLLEQLDELSSSVSPGVSASKHEQLELGCFTLRRALEEWYKDNWADQRNQSHDCSSDDGQGEHFSYAENQPTPQPPLESFWEATNMAYYWLFTLILNETTSSVLLQTPHRSQLSLDKPTAEQLAATNLTLATNILLASPQLLAEDTGWLGPQRYFFPLRRAMEYLGRIGSPLFPKAKNALMRTVGRLRA